MTVPVWHHDELRQVGLDFPGAVEIAAYDRNQGRDPASGPAGPAGLGVDSSTILTDVGCGTGQFACEAPADVGCVRA